jgi:hypothetical protein
MRERRSAARYVLQAPGQIIIQDAVYPCTIYDRSRTGARLIKFGKMQLPQAFDIDAAGEQHNC